MYLFKNTMINNNTKVLLDTNIILRHLLKDNEQQFKRTSKIFKEIANQEIIAYINILIIHEAIYILRYVYKIDRRLIANKLNLLIKLNNLKLLDIQKNQIFKVLEIYGNTKIDFPDIIYTEITKSLEISIATFDKDFKKLNANLYMF